MITILNIICYKKKERERVAHTRLLYRIIWNFSSLLQNQLDFRDWRSIAKLEGNKASVEPIRNLQLT